MEHLSETIKNTMLKVTAIPTIYIILNPHVERKIEMKNEFE